MYSSKFGINTYNFLWLIAIFFIFNTQIAFCQSEADTSHLYQEIHRQAQKHQVTQWVYEVIFEDPDDVENESPIIVKHSKTVNPFLKYKGKIIKEVFIATQDPFGFSVNNIYKKSPNRLEKFGNKFHITTQERIVKNIILFKANQEIDPLKMSESERLLRENSNINDARIYVKKYKGVQRDSVDVLVVIQDRWSTNITSNFDFQNPNIQLSESNIMGLGHEVVENATWRRSDSYINNNASYSIQNIKNSFIGASAVFANSIEKKLYGLNIIRPFYSPLAKWAGGISINNNYTFYKVYKPKTFEVINKYAVDYNMQDYWLAKSFPFSEDKEASIDRRSTNFVIGARFNNTLYFQKPDYSIDTNYLYQNQSLALVNFGYSKRKYYRDRYLYRFGANEDIPEGLSVEYVQGAMHDELSGTRSYSAIKLATGKHVQNIGYVSGGIGYGTFYNRNSKSLGVLNGDIYYFSELIKARRWYIRQFARYNLVQGFDRLSYERINLNNAQMNGFSSDLVYGKSKMTLNLELVFYTPYKVLGFRFAPIISCAFATIGDNLGSLINDNVFSAFALGFLIRNEYLIVNSFEFSIGLFPYMPGSADYLIKPNAIGSYTLKSRDFGISAPSTVLYQ